MTMPLTSPASTGTTGASGGAVAAREPQQGAPSEGAFHALIGHLMGALGGPALPDAQTVSTQPNGRSTTTQTSGPGATPAGAGLVVNALTAAPVTPPEDGTASPSATHGRDGMLGETATPVAPVVSNESPTGPQVDIPAGIQPGTAALGAPEVTTLDTSDAPATNAPLATAEATDSNAAPGAPLQQALTGGDRTDDVTTAGGNSAENEAMAGQTALAEPAPGVADLSDLPDFNAGDVQGGVLAPATSSGRADSAATGATLATATSSTGGTSGQIDGNQTEAMWRDVALRRAGHNVEASMETSQGTVDVTARRNGLHVDITVGAPARLAAFAGAESDLLRRELADAGHRLGDFDVREREPEPHPRRRDTHHQQEDDDA